MNDTYTAKALEGYFDYSFENGGDYSKAGNSGHLVQSRRSDGARLLFVPLNEEEHSSKFSWKTRGIKCRISEAPIIDEYRCVVECSDPDFFPILNRVAAAIIEDRLVGAKSTIERFREEKAFWGDVPTALTQERAAGLFGELFFMWNWLKPELVQILLDDCWGGSDQTDKDLNFESMQIEVKTSMSTNRPVKHTISTLHQLQSDNRPLLLFSLVAHPDEGGGWSLVGLVDQMLAYLSARSTRATSVFTTKLAGLDYVIHHPEMKKFRFALPNGRGSIFAVYEGFPRLTTGEDSDDERIHIQSYDISLSNVGDYRLNIAAPTDLNGLKMAYVANTIKLSK